MLSTINVTCMQGWTRWINKISKMLSTKIIRFLTIQICQYLEYKLEKKSIYFHAIVVRGDLPTSGWACTRGSCSSDGLCLQDVDPFFNLQDPSLECVHDVHPDQQWCGGWHIRLNTSVVTRGSVPFYHLLLVLHREATNITVQMKMVSEGKMQRFQRKRTLQVEGRVFKLWNKSTTVKDRSLRVNC